jgi:hypothetical protein
MFVNKIEMNRKLTSHNVVAVSDETEADGQGDDSDLPQRHVSLSTDGLTSRPSGVHGSPDTDSVADIVGTVSEGCGTGCDNLDERVKILNFVGVLGSMLVDACHAATLRSSENTDLSAVDVVRHTVQSTDDDLSRKANDSSFEVVTLVDGASAKLVLVQSTHSPAQRTLLLSQLGVVLFTGLCEQKTVSLARVLVFLNGCRPLLRGRVDINGRNLLGVVVEHGSISLCGWALELAGVLHDGVVGYLSEFGIRRSGPVEKQGTLDHVPDLEGVVLLDDLSVDVGNEEEGREDEQTKSDTKGDTRDEPSRLVSQTKLRRSLIDDGEGADSASNQEEER